jgi:hypothetical protein
MTREELRAYHVEAATKLRSYAADSGLRESNTKHYTKRAVFHDECVAVIDALLTPLHIPRSKYSCGPGCETAVGCEKCNGPRGRMQI